MHKYRNFLSKVITLILDKIPQNVIVLKTAATNEFSHPAINT